MDSTKPASRSTRRCLDTVGCGTPSCRSISPTDCCDETSRLRIARRFGSAMISNTDSMLFVYSTQHIRVKVYLGPRRRFQPACGDVPSEAFWRVQFRGLPVPKKFFLTKPNIFRPHSKSQRRCAPMVFGIIEECRSFSL